MHFQYIREVNAKEGKQLPVFKSEVYVGTSTKISTGHQM